MIPALITAVTIASSSTGGNYAGPGGVVQTGSEYSSSIVETSADGSGTTSVHIETNDNGQVRTMDRTIPDAQGASIEVRTESRGATATSSVRVVPKAARTTTVTRAASTSVKTTAASSATSSATTAASTTLVVPAPSSMVPPSLGERIVQAVVSFIRSLFSFVP